jgi:SsrA-binding protein
LQEDTKAVGFTIVPTLVFIDDKGRAKVDIALCRGKKEFDKRQTIKEKQDKREMDRAMKNF